MSDTMLPSGFDSLSIDEQIDFVNSVWDRISDRVDDASVPEWHKQIVSDRLEEHLSNPRDAKTWDDVRNRLRKKLRALEA